MRTIIYGAGGIGGGIGGYLARVGHDAILVARAGHVKAINEQGLRLVTTGGTQIIHAPAVTSPEQIRFKPDDVVFLSVKAQNTAEALLELSRVVKDIPIFCFQNGVGGEEAAARYFKRVYGVVVRLTASHLADGEVTVYREPPGSLVIGCYPKGIDELTEAVAKVLRSAGFFVMLTRDIMPYKWGKLVSNLFNAVGAITSARGRDVDPIIEAAQQEAKRILSQAGKRWVSMEQLAKDWPEAAGPPQATLDRGARNSTWQSLARGQTVETEYLNGEIVRLAKQLGTRAPINEKLLEISNEMEANHDPPGKYTPAQLSAILRLK